MGVQVSSPPGRALHPRTDPGEHLRIVSLRVYPGRSRWFWAPQEQAGGWDEAPSGGIGGRSLCGPPHRAIPHHGPGAVGTGRSNPPRATAQSTTIASAAVPLSPHCGLREVKHCGGVGEGRQREHASMDPVVPGFGRSLSIKCWMGEGVQDPNGVSSPRRKCTHRVPCRGGQPAPGASGRVTVPGVLPRGDNTISQSVSTAR